MLCALLAQLVGTWPVTCVNGFCHFGVRVVRVIGRWFLPGSWMWSIFDAFSRLFCKLLSWLVVLTVLSLVYDLYIFLKARVKIHNFLVLLKNLFRGQFRHLLWLGLSRHHFSLGSQSWCWKTLLGRKNLSGMWLLYESFELICQGIVLAGFGLFGFKAGFVGHSLVDFLKFV